MTKKAAPMAKAKTKRKLSAVMTKPKMTPPKTVKMPAKGRAKPAPKPKAKPLTVKQRDKVLAAAERILEADGYEAFGVARVAAKTKLNPAALKTSFPTKLHLLAAVLETNVEDDTDAAQRLILDELPFEADAVGAFAAMIEGLLARHNQGGWLRLFVNLDLERTEPEHADMWRLVEHRLIDRGTRIVTEMQRRGYIDDSHDPVTVQFFWNALMDGLSLRGRTQPKPMTHADIAKAVAPILLAGFAPKKS
ncbi:hypothetical protein sos41_33570 [Alphaproteobacteria bacterium SO-S41]|nr:hypothetical protein sos41_33570 [Alphaproteobacteria bacterium SO-S41]